MISYSHHLFSRTFEGGSFMDCERSRGTRKSTRGMSFVLPPHLPTPPTFRNSTVTHTSHASTPSALPPPPKRQQRFIPRPSPILVLCSIPLLVLPYLLGSLPPALAVPQDNCFSGMSGDGYSLPLRFRYHSESGSAYIRKITGRNPQ